jgi:hypothetical protein
MEKAKSEKKNKDVSIDKKTGRKKVVGKAHPPKQGYHGTNSEKTLNPEE